MQATGYSAIRGLKAGTLGGLAGAVVLGVLALLASMTMNQEVFYVTIGKKLGLGDAALVGGWLLHFVVGVVAGALFVAVTGLVRMFSLTDARRGLWVGALGGVAIWLVVYVPVTGILVSVFLTDPTFATGSFILHIVYGISTALVSLRLLRSSVRKTIQL